jgi:hypothetical protein
MAIPLLYQILTAPQEAAFIQAQLVQTKARLLATEPFQQCDDNEIRDLRFTPAHHLRCRNRPELVERMARQLCLACALHAASGEAMQHFAREVWQFMAWVSRGFVLLRDKDALSKEARSANLGARTADIAHSLTIQGGIAFNLTAHDLEAIKRLDPLDNLHAANLYELMRGYLPAHSDRAAYHILAVILVAFELESGPPEVVAVRLKQRIQDARRALDYKPSRRSRTAQAKRTQSRTAQTKPPDSHQI